MRLKRYTRELAEAVYHIFSRVVDRQFKFDDEVKEEFLTLLWQVATFSGVELITYALMTDHFHILVRVHPIWTVVSEEEVLSRIKTLYGAPEMQRVKNKLEHLREKGDDDAAEALLDTFRARMNNVSEFMKTLKLRMTIGYNKKHNREGTLWGGRFNSILLEDDPESRLLQFVAAYIDLNPVRAGIVGNPRSYRWCGFANAKGGGCWAEEGEKGLGTIYGRMPGKALDLYDAFLRGRMAKKGLGKGRKDASGPRPLTDILIRNETYIRSRAIGSRAFIFSIAGERPPGGVTEFPGGANGPLLAVGRLVRATSRA